MTVPSPYLVVRCEVPLIGLAAGQGISLFEAKVGFAGVGGKDDRTGLNPYILAVEQFETYLGLVDGAIERVILGSDHVICDYADQASFVFVNCFS